MEENKSPERTERSEKNHFNGGARRGNRHRGGHGYGGRNKPQNKEPQNKETKENLARNKDRPRDNTKNPRPEVRSEAPEAVAATGFTPPPEEERKYLFDYEPSSESAAPVDDGSPKVEVVGIRFRNGGKVYYFAPEGVSFSKGEHAVVETVRGVEYGEVALGNKEVPESEVVFPLKPVRRKATPEDDARNAENRRLEEEARPIWYEKVAKNGLEMQLVDVEYTHDNAKLCFYFTAEGRVDFRELVKDLAGVFRTRIELRQIGVRDEAKLFGGLGCCGRPFCCNTFLPDFAQVSIKMAKEQNLSLSSAKISGACGRLMCCLRFENDTYEREYATFPKVDTIVDTPKGRGVIVESSFLTGRIKVKMNSDQTLKVFGKSELKVLGMIKVKEEVSEDLKELEDK